MASTSYEQSWISVVWGSVAQPIWDSSCATTWSASRLVSYSRKTTYGFLSFLTAAFRRDSWNYSQRLVSLIFVDFHQSRHLSSRSKPFQQVSPKVVSSFAIIMTLIGQKQLACVWADSKYLDRPEFSLCLSSSASKTFGTTFICRGILWAFTLDLAFQFFA